MDKRQPILRPQENPEGDPHSRIHLVVSFGLLAFLFMALLSVLPWQEEVKANLRRYAVTITLYTPIVATLFSGIALLLHHRRGPGISLILAVLVILTALAGGMRG